MKNIIKLAVLAAICTASFISPEYAIANEAAENCVSINDNRARLKCYDKAFEAPASTTTAISSKWKIERDKSKLDDSNEVFVTLVSENKIPNRRNELKNAVFTFRCKENTTSAIFSFGGNFMSDNQNGGEVRYRIDSEPSKRVSMTESNNNVALGLWRGATAIPFLRQLLDKQSLVLEATPFRRNPVTVEFDISGIETPMAEVANLCGWEISAAKAAEAEAKRKQDLVSLLHQLRETSSAIAEAMAYANICKPFKFNRDGLRAYEQENAELFEAAKQTDFSSRIDSSARFYTTTNQGLSDADKRAFCEKGFSEFGPKGTKITNLLIPR